MGSWKSDTVYAHVAGAGAASLTDRVQEQGNRAATPDRLEIRTNKVAAGRQARLAFRRAENERDLYSDCGSTASDCHPKARQWRAALRQMQPLKGLQLLRRLNGTVNALIHYRDDAASYGEADYWATPMEALKGYGDCEDYAILKYLALRELGFSAGQLRIMIVLDREHDLAHAVLTVDLHGTTYMLDSRRSEPQEQSSVARYEPLYSINENEQWLYVAVRSRRAAVAMHD